MKRKITPFKWRELSKKQAFVLNWWRLDKYKDRDGIIVDGSIRSGKTVSMSFSYINWAMETFDGQNFILAGKTIGSFRRNVVVEVKKMMRGRKYRYRDNRSENVIEVHDPRTGHTNYFFIFGGKDEGSQDLVQGITAAGAFFDEVALMPQSFVNQATGRCSVEGSKFWFNCNPQGPRHWFRQEWILKLLSKKMLRVKFQIEDNLTLTKRILERYKNLYSGVFYERYILGLWVMAQGVIYDMFDYDRNVSKFNINKLKYYDRVVVSVDYGTQNPMTYGLYGINELAVSELTDYVEPAKGEAMDREIHLFKSYFYSGREKGVQKTDSEYGDDFDEFIKPIKEYLDYVIVDPSATSFKAELRKRGYRVVNAKNDVSDGIATHMNYLKMGLFVVDESCEDDVDEYHSYIWDEKKLDSGEEIPVKEFDHCMDRNRYTNLTDCILYKHSKLVKRHSGKGARK